MSIYSIDSEHPVLLAQGYRISAPQIEIEKGEEMNFIGDFTEQGVLDTHTIESGFWRRYH